MPTIAYNALTDFLKVTSAAAWPAVTLICGEELLCQKAYKRIVDTLMPKTERALAIERFDGTDDSIGTVLTSLNTYALLSGSKVVVLQDARLFYSVKTQQGLREKMVQAAQRGEMKKASRPFLNLMGLSGLDFADLGTPALRNKVVDDVDDQPPPWFSELIDYCRENGLKIPDKQNDADRLHAAMQKGFPDGHRLVITSDSVDRRKSLFKWIADMGVVVDCTVPKGETRADRTAQEAVMKTAIDDILAQSGKAMAMEARRRLMQWTGFDLPTLTGNLEKLISFVGDRKTITDADVTTVLRRTRKDPIFSFTNALADRDLPAALFFMQSLLDDDMHPLQLMAAMANQIRRLLLAKDFIIRDRGRFWSAGMPFAQFKAGPFKAVVADDRAFTTLTHEWHAILNSPVQGKKGRTPSASDLVLVRNPKSPFPVFQALAKADNYSLDELTAAVIALSEIDKRIKSTGQDPLLLLEAFLIRLCRKSGQSPLIKN